MRGEELKEALTRSGALRQGHFLLSSGRHSDKYIQCARLFMDPSVALDVGRQIAGGYGEREIDMVVAPAFGGIIPGFATSLALDCPSVFAERVDGRFRFRRGFEVKNSQRILIVEDVVTTGGSVLELAGIVESMGAYVAGISAVVSRGERTSWDYDFISLLSLPVKSYAPEDCPMCVEGEPLQKPGSR